MRKKGITKERIELGERIRILRKRQDYCQESLAEVLEISPMTLSRIENGVTSLDVELLLKLSEALDTPVDVILGLNGEVKIRRKTKLK